MQAVEPGGEGGAPVEGGIPFGPYRLTGVIGRGATSTVYVASETSGGDPVAVKVLDPALAALPGLADRLEAESAVLAGLSAPHLCATRGTGVVDGNRYLAMTYIEGASLRTVEESAGRLGAPQALGVLAGVLEGLAAAHGAGLVHGDVKPENILCDRSGEAWLCDFGQVLPIGGATEGGTPAYMSPEAARGLPLDARADLYSLGVVLYEALAGHRPFTGANDLAVLRQHAESPPPPLEAAGPATRALVARCLAKDPADRPQSATVLLHDLEAAAAADEGSDWRARAALVGLVATAATGVEALAAPAPAAAATPSASSAAPHPAAPVAKAGGLVSSHPVLTAAAAVVVAAGLAAGGAVLARTAKGTTTPTTVAPAKVATARPPDFARFAGHWSSVFRAGGTLVDGAEMVVEVSGQGTFLDQGTTTPFQLTSIDGTTATAHITGPTTDPSGSSSTGFGPIGSTLTIAFTPAGSSTPVNRVTVSYGNGPTTIYCPAAGSPLPSTCVNN